MAADRYYLCTHRPKKISEARFRIPSEFRHQPRIQYRQDVRLLIIQQVACVQVTVDKIVSVVRKHELTTLRAQLR
jgi:hypothetical protein